MRHVRYYRQRMAGIESEIDYIQEEVDDNYFYTTKELYDTNRKFFGCTYESAEDGLDGLAEGIATTKWKV